jgi:hypothetical protein
MILISVPGIDALACRPNWASRGTRVSGKQDIRPDDGSNDLVAPGRFRGLCVARLGSRKRDRVGRQPQSTADDAVSAGPNLFRWGSQMSRRKRVSGPKTLAVAAIALFLTADRWQAASAGMLLSGTGHNYCLDIADSSVARGAPAVVEPCDDSSASQNWTFLDFDPSDSSAKTIGDHIYSRLVRPVYPEGSQFCLGVARSDGTTIVQGPCSDSLQDVPQDLSQVWTPYKANSEVVPPRGRVTMWLKNGLYGLCIGIKGGSHAAGAAVVLGKCVITSGNVTQHWTGPLP